LRPRHQQLGCGPRFDVHVTRGVRLHLHHEASRSRRLGLAEDVADAIPRRHTDVVPNAKLEAEHVVSGHAVFFDDEIGLVDDCHAV
jgi:hypothetical protein